MTASLSVVTLYRDPVEAVRWLVEAFDVEVLDCEGHQRSVGSCRPGQPW
ncbi:hypothetical protein [Brachybacterium sp. P6-10-X1]|nr:hypothetical protein [Brachybacterium sp. P6-10-X1]